MEEAKSHLQFFLQSTNAPITPDQLRKYLTATTGNEKYANFQAASMALKMEQQRLRDGRTTRTE